DGDALCGRLARVCVSLSAGAGNRLRLDAVRLSALPPRPPGRAGTYPDRGGGKRAAAWRGVVGVPLRPSAGADARTVGGAAAVLRGPRVLLVLAPAPLFRQQGRPVGDLPGIGHVPASSAAGRAGRGFARH